MIVKFLIPVESISLSLSYKKEEFNQVPKLIQYNLQQLKMIGDKVGIYNFTDYSNAYIKQAKAQISFLGSIGWEEQTLLSLKLRMINFKSTFEEMLNSDA